MARLPNGEVTKETMATFGKYYRVDWPVPSKTGVTLRTIWEISVIDDVPRLVSAFIL